MCVEHFEKAHLRRDDLTGEQLKNTSVGAL
jgi:hypothetical protein